jgi:hypothetical protein
VILPSPSAQDAGMVPKLWFLFNYFCFDIYQNVSLYLIHTTLTIFNLNTCILFVRFDILTDIIMTIPVSDEPAVSIFRVAEYSGSSTLKMGPKGSSETLVATGLHGAISQNTMTFNILFVSHSYNLLLALEMLLIPEMVISFEVFI